MFARAASFFNATLKTQNKFCFQSRSVPARALNFNTIVSLVCTCLEFFLTLRSKTLEKFCLNSRSVTFLFRGTPRFPSLFYFIKYLSISLAHSRPSAIAHTTRDCPLCISPAVKIFSFAV